MIGGSDGFVAGSDYAQNEAAHPQIQIPSLTFATGVVTMSDLRDLWLFRVLDSLPAPAPGGGGDSVPGISFRRCMV